MGNDTPEQTMPSREKYWTELSIEEKSERMRQIVKHKDSQIEQLFDVVYKLKRQFEVHLHGDKSILVPINCNDDEKMVNPRAFEVRRISKNENEVYF